MPKNLAVKLTPKGEKHLHSRHPWIFDRSIDKCTAGGVAGDIAIIYGAKSNKIIGVGLYDPHSPIRIKMLVYGGGAMINAGWITDKFNQARQLRSDLLRTDTDSYRLVYGENDGLPGLIIDVYAHVAVVKLYSMIWQPYLQIVIDAIVDIVEPGGIVLRLSRLVSKESQELNDGDVIYGTLDDPEVIFREHGLRFAAHVLKGHKTGYFLDHRHNRHRIGQLAKGKTVLDIFAYAGGFTVHALAGGALSATSLDISAQALSMAQNNVVLNGLQARHEIMAIDAFDGMQQLEQEGRIFDIVIVDPPSFAKSAKDIDKAIHSYRRLAGLAIPLVARGGILLCASCSSRVSSDDFFQLVIDELDQSGRRYSILDRTYHDSDHPIGFKEGAYLKSIYLQMDS